MLAGCTKEASDSRITEESNAEQHDIPLSIVIAQIKVVKESSRVHSFLCRKIYDFDDTEQYFR